MIFRLIRGVAAAVGMILCAVVAFILAAVEVIAFSSLLPPLVAMAVLILGLGVGLRRLLSWDFVDFLCGLVAAELVTLLVISHFSGFTWSRLFDWFNLYWLAFTNLFIAVPWLLGFGIGSRILHAADKGRKTAV